MLSSDQTLILYEQNRNLVRKFKIPPTTHHVQEALNFYNGIEWLLSDLLFAAYNLNGQIKVFDVGFSDLSLFYATRYPIEFKSTSEYLNSNIFVALTSQGTLSTSTTANSGLTSTSKTATTHANRFVRLVSSRSIFTDSLFSCFHYSKGPFGLFRLTLPDNFNHISLVNHYLKSSQHFTTTDIALQQTSNSAQLNLKNNSNRAEDNPVVCKHLQNSVSLLNTLDWNEESHACLSILNRVLNFILSERVAFNFRTELLLEEALGSFYKPKRALLEKTIYEYKHQVSRYARRFFYQLLKHGSLNKAFLLAVDIGAKDLFNDLYYCALDKCENQLAEVCRKKYQEVVDEETQSKLRNELNRSITTIDDNIKGNSTEFDKYSVSSSENNSAESDNDDSFDSECEYEYLSSDQRMQMEKDSKFKLTKKNLKFLMQQQTQNESDVQQSRVPKMYSEEDIENFAHGVLKENFFVYQLSLDS